MNSSEFDQLVAEARRFGVRTDDEKLLTFLRERGAGKIESIKIVKALKGLTLREADDLVHYSATWADRREHDEAALDGLLEMAGENGVLDLSNEKINEG